MPSVPDVPALETRVRELEDENRRLREELGKRGSSPQNDLRAVLNHLPAMIAYWDKDLRNLFANVAYARSYGVTAERLRTMSLQELIGDARFFELKPHLDAVLRGEAQQFEHAFPMADGEGVQQRRADYVPEFVDGKVRGFYVHASNVTTIKAAVDALRETEAKLQGLFDLSPLGIALNDLNGRHVEFNEAFRQLSGYDEAELRALDYWTLTPRSFEAAEIERMEALKLTGRYGPYEKEYVRKDGTRVPVQLSGVMITARDGKPYVWSIVEDISVRKRHELDLMQAKEGAEAASRSKSAFLATMSHELRTPLNGILGMAQMLLGDLPGDERRQYATTIFDSGNALLALLNDVLDFSKIEAGRFELKLGPCDPGLIIAESETLFAQLVRQKGLELGASWHGPRGQLYRADANRLGQMVLNLVNNAIKFTPAGYVRVDATEVERRGTSALLEFSVEDSGIGIPLEEQRRLFRPFTQLDSSPTRQHGGTGLGLSIVRKLAGLMGGEAGVESEAGKGSRFWFRVQVEVLHAAASLEQPTSVADHGKLGGYALIVEDNPINRRVAEALLNKLGVRTSCVENGQFAVDAITARGVRPDVILMDVHMPVMDGIEATKRIRAWETAEGLRAMPIVALTAAAYEADRLNCLANGMDGFLAKPINARDLTTTLSRWLSR